ncbi:MAG: domain containing protein, partial [Bacteroidetes bacterium]|nr:domain containing protein [Bacteroidota bacterium]
LGPPTGPLTSPGSLFYATYTVVATNTVNLCKSTQTFIVNQNFKVPTPFTSIGTPTAIYCTGQPVVLSYTNNAANSGVLGAVGQVVSWMGPAPQTSAAVQAYNAFIPGVYSLTVRDSYNGCLAVKTVTVLDQTQPPVLVNPVSTFTLDCGANTGSSGQSSPMQIVLSQSLTSWSFLITEYPVGANFGPGAAGQAVITAPNGLTSSGVYTSQAITTDKTGTFAFFIINQITGCRTTGTINMVPGALAADFTADPLTGYAPLGVNFTNNSASSANSNSITSVWSFGNGTSQTTTTNISPFTTYTSPGTYTVTLVASKGLCIDTAFAVIKVEIPSKLDVPNVFTPNGDGSNDLFFLKTQNLTEITALIYDRWGNKVYDVTSNTGNIGWDGKNQEGKDCPSGTYFYIIKATGKDGTSYDKKGNVSLYR